MLVKSAVRAAAPLTVNALSELITTSAQRLYVRRIKVTLAAATALELALLRPTGVGTASASSTPVVCDPNDVAGTIVGKITTAWSAQPTPGANYMDKHYFPASAGAGYEWVFDRGELIVGASGSLVLWNIGGSTGPACDVCWTWEE